MATNTPQPARPAKPAPKTAPQRAASKPATGAKTGAQRPPKARPADRPAWTFLTNHSHVLICLWRSPDARLRDVAQSVGITERAVQTIVADLEEARVLTRTKQGRRNRYTLHENAMLRHPVEAGHRVGELLHLIGKDQPLPGSGA